MVFNGLVINAVHNYKKVAVNENKANTINVKDREASSDNNWRL
jgi:hypothetical protein